MKDYEVNMAAMKDEISERENVIAQNYTTIQLLRKRLADLEKHKYVLGFRTQVREPSLVPAAWPVTDCGASVTRGEPCRSTVLEKSHAG